MVKVHYTGKLLNGKVFDTSVIDVAKANNVFTEGRDYEPISFPLGAGQVIQGWDEGLTYINEGAKAILLIPSYLAYGERGAGGEIPPNSPLIFEVEMVKVGN
jgi:FKBP-type peptidyl-prolyl cis-trans isomerase